MSRLLKIVTRTAESFLNEKLMLEFVDEFYYVAEKRKKT